MGIRFLFGGDKIFWNQAEVMVSHVNVLNVTKLYILKWLMLYYVNKKRGKIAWETSDFRWASHYLLLNSNGVNRQRSVNIRAAVQPQDWGLPVKAVTHAHQCGSPRHPEASLPWAFSAPGTTPVHSASDEGSRASGL